MCNWIDDHLGKLLIAFQIVVLVSIGLFVWANSIKSGYVINKSHHNAYVSTSCNKNDCTTAHVPESWSLELSENDDTGWINVDHDTWLRYEVGQHYPNPK